MLRATTVIRKPAVKPDRVVDTVVLDQEGRSGRRMDLKGENGLDFQLDLDKTAALNDGDAVKLEDGRLVRVKAAAQRLLEVRAENPLRLFRVAYQLGGQHAPAEITADAIYVEDEDALAELVRGQGCTATPVMRAFQPEREVHAHDHHHSHEHHQGHDHHHGHDHHAHDDDHHHGHEHSHAHHDHAHHDHQHGHGCGHDDCKHEH